MWFTCPVALVCSEVKGGGTDSHWAPTCQIPVTSLDILRYMAFLSVPFLSWIYGTLPLFPPPPSSSTFWITWDKGQLSYHKVLECKIKMEFIGNILHVGNHRCFWKLKWQSVGGQMLFSQVVDGVFGWPSQCLSRVLSSTACPHRWVWFSETVENLFSLYPHLLRPLSLYGKRKGDILSCFSLGDSVCHILPQIRPGLIVCSLFHCWPSISSLSIRICSWVVLHSPLL